MEQVMFILVNGLLIVTVLAFALHACAYIFKFWWARRISCKLGWHSAFSGFELVRHDGVFEHRRCKWCDKTILIDPNGNQL